MDKYFKIIEDGYISLVGTGGGDGEISREEYETILAVIENRPTAEDGYIYKLTTDLTWELCEAPVVELDEEANEADLLDALEDLGVTLNEEI